MQKQLAGGLILRSLSEGYASDRDQLPKFNSEVNGQHETQAGKDALAQWVSDLLNSHPVITPDEFFVVVDPAKKDKVVSATMLIPHTWRYEDIPLAVGRPELVATDADYRGRGLVRALFEAVHEHSAALGHHMQAITGIPYFYRQFGYTMAVDLGQYATYPLDVMSDAKPDYKPAFTLRKATHDDVPNLMRWYDTLARQRLLSEMRSADEWRYEVGGRHPHSSQSIDYQIILNAAGEGVGYLELFTFLWERYLINCSGFVVGDEASYLETFEDVIRGIKQWARTQYGHCPALLSLGAGLHDSLDRLIDRSEGGHIRRANYAWYVRAPQTISFFKHIQPVLERRLEYSGAHRYTGELKIGFYDLTGIHFKFEHGRITSIEAIQGKDNYDILFPYHMLWNVVFGHHTVDDIRAILPDVWGNGKAALLLDALFPKKKSWLKGVM